MVRPSSKLAAQPPTHFQASSPRFCPNFLLPLQKLTLYVFLEALSQARLRLAVELWETEQNYIRGLQALLTAYKAPLLHAIAKGHPLIPEEAIEAVFMNVEGT